MSNLGQVVVTLQCSSSLGCINVHMAIKSGIYLCMLRALTQRVRMLSREDGVPLNRSARDYSVKRFEQSRGLDSALYNDAPLYLMFGLVHVFVARNVGRFLTLFHIAFPLRDRKLKKPLKGRVSYHNIRAGYTGTDRGKIRHG